MHMTQTAQKPEVPQGTGAMFLSMFLMLMLLIAFINPSVRNTVVGAMNVALLPTIGFAGRYPVITIMIAELIVVLVGTTLRILFTDFVAQARMQKIMSALRKIQRDAFRTRDQDKIKRLQAIQSRYLMENTQIMNKQFKILPITLIIIFPLFTWLGVFLYSLPYPAFTLPWAARSYLDRTYILFPEWVYLYAILGIPFTQIYQRALRYFMLKRRLARL